MIPELVAPRELSAKNISRLNTKFPISDTPTKSYKPVESELVRIKYFVIDFSFYLPGCSQFYL